MNKLILSFVTIISLCFFSCKDTASTTSSDSSSSDSVAEKNRANSREVYRAMETGDVSKVDSFIDKDIVDHQDNVKGLDSLKKMFASMHNSIKDLKFETIANATDGDYNIAYVKMTGTTVDASMGMPAGTKLDMKFVDVVKMSNGKAVEHWGYSDRNDMMKMMEMGKGQNGMGNKMDTKMKDTSIKK